MEHERSDLRAVLWKEAAGTLHPAGPANDNKEVSEDARHFITLPKSKLVQLMQEHTPDGIAGGSE